MFQVFNLARPHQRRVARRSVLLRELMRIPQFHSEFNAESSVGSAVSARIHRHPRTPLFRPTSTLPSPHQRRHRRPLSTPPSIFLVGAAHKSQFHSDFNAESSVGSAVSARIHRYPPTPLLPKTLSYALAPLLLPAPPRPLSSLSTKWKSDPTPIRPDPSPTSRAGTVFFIAIFFS